MCGIAGVVSFGRPGQALLPRARAMQAVLRPRGPDGAGECALPDVALAATRLALLDLARGDQPALSPDGRYALVYNGELYNFRELREELPWDFRTDGDSEVVLAAWATWGPACLERFEGMFAFFVWDAEERVGHAVRDLLGVKPLVWAREGARFLFASEAKALVRTRPGPVRADREALCEYLVAPCFSGVERSPFGGVEILPPGGLLRVGPDGVAQKCWGHHRLAPEAGATAEELAEALRAALPRAVRRALVADVPVGSYLSGGLDSTLLTSLAARENPELETFTVVHEGHADYPYASRIVVSDDVPVARACAAELGVRAREVPVARAALADALAEISRIDDALPAWEQELAQHFLARAAARRCKAVLVGDAADETHYGYHFLLDPEATARPAAILARFAAPGLRPGLREEVTEALERRYRALVEAEGQGWDDPDARILATSCLIVRRWLPRLLHNGDIHAMAWGLEARVPFADRELLAVAARVPPALGFAEGREKALLRRAARGLVPERARTRRKSALPCDQAAGRVYQAAAARALEEHGAFLAAYLDPPAVRGLCARERLAEAERMMLFRIACLGFWLEAYEVAA